VANTRVHRLHTSASNWLVNATRSSSTGRDSLAATAAWPQAARRSGGGGATSDTCPGAADDTRTRFQLAPSGKSTSAMGGRKGMRVAGRPQLAEVGLLGQSVSVQASVCLPACLPARMLACAWVCEARTGGAQPIVHRVKPEYRAACDSIANFPLHRAEYALSGYRPKSFVGSAGKSTV
jgi:hypothetical protein